MFDQFDFEGFWDKRPDAVRIAQGPVCTDEMILEAEAELGYKLPASYIWLMKQCNGGYLKRSCFPLGCELDGVGLYTEMPALKGIGMKDAHSAYTINGLYGTRLMIEDWGYPDIGIVIGVGFFGPHEAFFLDYRECGPQGEPRVSHVDAEYDYRITVLANDFETYIRSLVDDPNM